MAFKYSLCMCALIIGNAKPQSEGLNPQNQVKPNLSSIQKTASLNSQFAVLYPKIVETQALSVDYSSTLIMYGSGFRV